MNPKRHVASLIMDETTRTFRPTMGVARSLLPTPATQARRSVEGRSPDAQRHLLAAQHRRPLARLARALRPLADRLRPLLADARKRLARPDHPTLAVAPHRRRADRLRPVLHRRHQRPRQPRGGGGREKKIGRPVSRPTTLSAAPAAVSARKSTWSATATA